MLKHVAITSLAAAAIFSTATVAMAPLTPAAAQVSITFGSPPPPPVYERVPAPRHGYVWAPGHYRIVNDRYVWTPGHWIAERPGQRWMGAQWVNVNGRWHYRPGRWEPVYVSQSGRFGPYGDIDRDGVPNRYDRYDSRRGAFGDRDRDGVPNMFDSYDHRRWTP